MKRSIFSLRNAPVIATPDAPDASEPDFLCCTILVRRFSRHPFKQRRSVRNCPQGLPPFSRQASLVTAEATARIRIRKPPPDTGVQKGIDDPPYPRIRIRDLRQQPGRSSGKTVCKFLPPDPYRRLEHRTDTQVQV